MARPLKDGIDYFPFDVGFLNDKKVKLYLEETLTFRLFTPEAVVAINPAIKKLAKK